MDSKTFEKVSGSGLLVASLALGMVAGCTGGDSSSSGSTYTGSAPGKNGDVTVEVVYEDGEIKSVTVTEQQETEGIAEPALEQIPAAIVEAQTPNVDTVSGATVTSEAIINATKAALESAGVDVDSLGEAAAHENVPVTYTAGTYTATAAGYNGDVTLDVTFSEDGIEDIQINEEKETAHVGTVAYEIMFDDAIEANGSGIDAVSGATFTSKAIKDCLNDAAEQAEASDLDGFKKNTVVHEAQDDIEETYDVVVVGAGGAGMGAAAQAAQNGDSVLVIEENAEIGGNTLVSGGQFQSVMPYLVWDEDDPDATTGTWDYNGETYDKVKSANGYITVLKTIANWSEEPFDESYFDDHEFVAGEIEELSKAGVHEEYLPTLQALKKEINAYLDWAQPQLDAGTPETDLTLFSTVNLHIFQTYYGGLRQNADGTEWIYGDYDLVSQFIEDGQGLKEWLEDQGALFDDASQNTLIGALWHRENRQLGADMDGDGEVDDGASGNWGAYFVNTENTILETSETADKNKIMTRTTAESLIVDEGGNVTGVNATMYDGTKVTAHATKGVVMATGGYAANISMVEETNEYWSSDYVTDATKTTNRSSLVGDGITMGEEAGASLTGMGWAQMMPIAWIDNGNLAYGSGANCIYINPTTGNRFVNETSERDVLSLGEFENGVEVDGTKGVFLEIANAEVEVGSGYPFGQYDEMDDRVYFFSSEEELQEILDEFGMEADPADIYATIEDYDTSLMNDEMPKDADKTGWTALIGTVADEDGNYDMDNYDASSQTYRVRIMAPSAHHTMGGLTIDTDRHVLDSDGNIIKGLYAAGEVSGGIHGGNRLGGNAIVEIFVSGRTAANAIHEDNE